MRHSMKPDLRADYKIRLYTGPPNPFFEVSTFMKTAKAQAAALRVELGWAAIRVEGVDHSNSGMAEAAAPYVR